MFIFYNLKTCQQYFYTVMFQALPRAVNAVLALPSLSNSKTKVRFYKFLLS